MPGESTSGAYPLPEGTNDPVELYRKYYKGGHFEVPAEDAPFDDMYAVYSLDHFFDVFKASIDGPEQYESKEEFQNELEAVNAYNTRFVAWLESLGMKPNLLPEIERYSGDAKESLRRYQEQI